MLYFGMMPQDPGDGVRRYQPEHLLQNHQRGTGHLLFKKSPRAYVFGCLLWQFQFQQRLDLSKVAPGNVQKEMQGMKSKGTPPPSV